MKNLLFFAAALAFVGAGCAGNAPAPAQVETEGSAGASLQVPAPGFEDVEEMVVEEGDEQGAGVEASTEVEVEIESEPASESDEPNGQQASEPEPVPVTIVAKTWQFEPSTVRVKEGQRVNLQIVSIDVAHGFNLSAFGIDERLEPGKTMRTSFVADKKGSFPFFCDVFCGDGHGGMRGTLIVE